MIKLKSFLKPFILLLLAAVALLFLQAVCDLNLPNLMSDIVNVGIQQSGVEHAAPDAISQEGAALLKRFMSEEDAALMQSSYTLSSPDKKVYPHAGGDIYLRNSSLSAESLAQLDAVMGDAAWSMVNVLQTMGGGQGAASEASMEDLSDLDLSTLYESIPMLAAIPQEVITAQWSQTAGTDQLIIKQVGIVFATGFLKELGVDIAQVQTNYILHVGLNMLLIALLGGAATVLVSLLSSRIAAGVARDLRGAVFEKVESFSNNEFDSFSTASLITRTTNDITQIQQVLMIGIRMICYAPIMAVGGIIMAVNKSAAMSWVIAVACIALLGLILVVFAVAMPKFKIIQKLVDKLNLVSRENLTGLQVIRAFGTRDYELERFDGVNLDVTKTNRYVNRVMVTMMPMMMLIMNGIAILIVWVGAGQIDAAAMQVGDMMAYIQYAMQIIMSFLMIAMMFIFIPRASVSADRIAEVLGTEATIRDPEQPLSFDESSKGYVTFNHVSFRYQGAEEDALHDISFTAKPGETTAIIGSTGSGKSTLANLILRFYDITAGEILVGGTDIRKVAQHDLRERIGYVPQKGVLMAGTIDSNLRYGAKEASNETVEKAVRIAQSMDFIKEKEAGFKEPIAQGGTNVSGGQKQRLSIARALAKQPDILIFDDSFSALDFKTDVALRRALKEEVASITVLLVAQRVNTIMNAEQIIVLEHGRMVGQGTHQELLKTCPQYLEIASSQMSSAEMA